MRERIGGAAGAGGAVLLANRAWKVKHGPLQFCVGVKTQARRKQPFLALRSAEENAKIVRGAHGGAIQGQSATISKICRTEHRVSCVAPQDQARRRPFIKISKTRFSGAHTIYFLALTTQLMRVVFSTWMHGKGCFWCDLCAWGTFFDLTRGFNASPPSCRAADVTPQQQKPAASQRAVG